jgi:hypothetical protein
MGVVVEEVLLSLVLPQAGNFFLLGRVVEEAFFFLEVVEADAESLVQLPPLPLHRLLIFSPGEGSAFVAPGEGDDISFFQPEEEVEEVNFFLVPSLVDGFY